MSTPSLDSSRDRVLRTAADGGIVLAHATAARAVAAWTLAPAPRDPARHLEAAHAQARDHLARLGVHDPSREVPAVMTDELFSRLTDAEPAPLTAPAAVGRYTYTPRKALRRVLDHALDHLNQIDQWLDVAASRHRADADRRLGAVDGDPAGRPAAAGARPISTRGSGGSTRPSGSSSSGRRSSAQSSSTGSRPTGAGRCAASSTTSRARSGSTRRRSTRRYPAPTRRAGTRRPAGAWTRRVRVARGRDPDASIVYPGLYGTLHTPEEVVGLVLTIEGELLAGAR